MTYRAHLVATAAAIVALTLSATGRQLIEGFETFAPVAYDDAQPRHVLKPGDKVRGTLTIAFGHTGGDVHIGDRVTRAQGDALFAGDLHPVEAAINRLVKRPLLQCQFDALAAFVFNAGVAAFSGSTLLKKVNAGAPEAEVQAQFRRWIRGRVDGVSKIMSGLVRRRDAEAAMWAGQALPATMGLVDLLDEETARGAAVEPMPFVEEHTHILQSGSVRASAVKLAALVTGAIGALNDQLQDLGAFAMHLVHNLVAQPDQAADLASRVQAAGAKYHIPHLVEAAGAAIAIITVWQLYRRLRELGEAKR